MNTTKLAGVLVPVFALRRNNDLGIGDTKAVQQAIDFCFRNNLSVLQVLPINETGADNSPYNTISSVALDPTLLTVEPDTIPGLDQNTYDSLVEASGIRHLDQSIVHYQIVKKLKQDLLKVAWENFANQHLISNQSSQAKSFLEFEAIHKDWLLPYTIFRALIDLHNGNACWTQWSDKWHDYDYAQAQIANNKELSSVCKFYSFVQWLSFQQWTQLKHYANSCGVYLMGDMPFGISRYSADVWSQRHLFDLEWFGGAPPEAHFEWDLFTRKWGQNWGIPLYKWQEHKNQNYKWWRQRVQRLMDIFHYFRIDHVLGFFRIYAFPWAPEQNNEFLTLTDQLAQEKTGGRLPQFLPSPDYSQEMAKLNAQAGEIMLKIILEAAGGNNVIAEDLGVVPDYVRPLLRQLGIPGFSIPTFERHDDYSYKRKEELPVCSLATYGTHDHKPLALFYQDLVKRWHGPDGHVAWLEVQRLMRFIGMDENNPPTTFTEELHHALLCSLLETPCWLVVFTISDILGSCEEFNVPGAVSSSNWSQRLAMSFIDYQNTEPFAAKIKDLANLISKSSRQANILKRVQ